MGGLQRRIKQLEAAKQAKPGGECAECGYIDGEAPYDVVVTWNDFDADEGEPEEEFCEQCGAQLSYTIVWDDIPSRKRGGEGGPVR